jgi:hypothetical protein
VDNSLIDERRERDRRQRRASDNRRENLHAPDLPAQDVPMPLLDAVSVTTSSSDPRTSSRPVQAALNRKSASK